MGIYRLLILFSLLGWLANQPVLADIDPSEYELKTAVRSEKERERLKAEFEADKKRAAALQREEDEKEVNRLAAEKAAWEALPYPAQLTQTRCTVCHATDDYVNQRHNRIGWELSILRMQYLNDAPLAAGERGVIASHLAEIYPATGGAALIEVLLQLAAALFPVWLWFTWKITHLKFGRRR